MDIVLEVLDSFVLDPFFAAILPATATGAGAFGANKTISSAREWGTPGYTGNSYVYHPASAYIQVSPGPSAYQTSFQRDNPLRQLITLYFITWIFGVVLYFVFATLSYYTIFDHSTFNHPRYLKNQVRLEIAQTMESLPLMAFLTAPCFLLEVRGYSKLYDTTAEGPGLWYNIVQFPFFILFTDCFIYWIHRGLHHPLVYRRLHKPHHKWVMPTPFASHAFHPVDGFAQSIPYHVFPFLFPLQKWAYVVLFVFINFWTILIHDGEFVMNNPIINGAACHTIHHLKFNFNFGQFTTLWDRLGGSYREPAMQLFEKEHTQMSKEEWQQHHEKVLREDEAPNAKTKKVQ